MRHDMSGLPVSDHPPTPVSRVAGSQRHATTSDCSERLILEKESTISKDALSGGELIGTKRLYEKRFAS